MIRTAMVILLIFCSALVAFAQPSIEFERRVVDFGEVEEGQILKHEFEFRNAGTETLIINDVSAS